MNIELIAKECHENNRTYCITLGDYSQLPWEDTNEQIKQSAIDGVKYKIENWEVSSEDMHNNWLTFKISDGWVYGDVKDIDKKTHPSMIPYYDLNTDEKEKDAIFIATVEQLYTKS